MPSSKTRERSLDQLRRDLEDQEAEYDELVMAQALPAGWEDIAEDLPCRPPKTRVTLAIDAEVAKFFRAMGHGHQARMNRVLRLYMNATRSEILWRREMED